MKATSSSSSFAVYITLCITAVVHISYGDSRETCQPCPVTTTPPIEHVLPLELKAANHIDLICPASEKCGKVFLHGFMFNVTCNDGYTFGKFDGSPVFTLFVNGTWTPTVPECKRMCKPLKNVRCRYKREEINCSNSVPVGTEATCRTGQMPGQSVVCKENGQWSYDLEDCPTTGMCKPLKNVRYRYKGEETNCSNSVLVGTEATCRTGHMPGPSVVCKENGQWDYDLVDCPTTGMCKPLKNVRCRYKGEETNCSNSVPVGTEATCRTGHMLGPSVVCKENGQWNYDLVDCPTSACGRKNSSESISPWFFVILEGDPPKQYCKGTLISPHIVLTSAYCVCFGTGRSLMSPEQFRVIAGNQWLNKKPHGATVRVRHISVNPLYFGIDTHFAANVALIDLESSVPFTPACVDWDLEFPIAERESASITVGDDVGTLQEVVVQCESYVNCVAAWPENERHYITHDKFCVKFSNVRDDYIYHSSGLVVQRNGVSYVKGFVSHYITISNVGRIDLAMNLSDVGLIHWLRQTKQSFDAHHIDN